MTATCMLSSASILRDKGHPAVDLEITAPKILTAPWKTTRIFFRQRARKFDIVEGVCVQGDYKEALDDNGAPCLRPRRKDRFGATSVHRNNRIVN